MTPHTPLTPCQILKLQCLPANPRFRGLQLITHELQIRYTFCDADFIEDCS